MAEPTSEWGKELVQKFSESNAKVTKLWTIGVVSAPIVMGVGAWTLLTVIGLQTSAAVLEAGQKSISSDINQMSVDIRRISTEIKQDRDTTQKLQVEAARLQTIIDRLERLAPPPPPPR